MDPDQDVGKLIPHEKLVGFARQQKGMLLEGAMLCLAPVDLLHDPHCLMSAKSMRTFVK